MNEFLENLKKQAAEQPIIALGVAAALLTAGSKFVNSVAWKKEVDRRVKKSKK